MSSYQTDANAASGRRNHWERGAGVGGPAETTDTVQHKLSPRGEHVLCMGSFKKTLKYSKIVTFIKIRY